MNIVNRYKIDKPLVESSEAVFPARPFPRKHVLCVFDDVRDALQATFTLLAADYGASNVHMLVSQHYLSVIERRQTLLSFLTSMDLNVYANEAKRGRSILVVRPRNYRQIVQIRHLLVPHHGRLMRYIDTWTTTELLP